MKKTVLMAILISFAGIAPAAENQWHLSFRGNEFHISSDDSPFGDPDDLVVVPNFENNAMENVSFTGHGEAFIIHRKPESRREYYVRIEAQPQTAGEIHAIGEDLVARFRDSDAYDAFSHTFYTNGFLIATTMSGENNIHIFVQINGKTVLFRYSEPGGKDTLANTRNKVEALLDSLLAANGASK